MPRRIAQNTLNASTIDILNVIRQNASYEYQSSVPKVESANDIPVVGAVIYGTPAFANQFLNALVNRIALVRLQGATFNNPYAILKKGYLEFGETVESIFVNIAKVVDFDVEKAEAREFKRTLPDVRSAFHTMNWRVMYPVTIQDEDLKQAFLSLEGITDLIEKIVDSVYTAADYDEFLLFKYLLIKAVTSGKMKPVKIGDGTDLKESAVQFRGISNILPFMSSEYNEAHVKTNTPKSRQVIFMDAMFNAQFDVNVLASAFNMEKADFMGRLFLIDNWETFDNERFEIIRKNSTGISEVTTAELNLMKNVKAIIIDEQWFQVFDNNNKFTEKYVASGMYWNYFYNTWKTISNSPFANAVVFVTSKADIALPDTLTVHIDSKDKSKEGVVFTFSVEGNGDNLAPTDYEFIQTEGLTKASIAVQKYGAILIPSAKLGTEITLVVKCGGAIYRASSKITANNDVNSTVSLTKN